MQHSALSTGTLLPTLAGASYRHDCLSGSCESLRLFDLQPGLPIRGTLRHCDLKDDPQYEAVSYTWGSEDDAETIYINDFQFVIRVNLYAFLYQLCRQGQPRTLWCDAICIDQQSIEERNAQVQRMGQIYKNAVQVLVWLGPASRDSDLAFDFIAINPSGSQPSTPAFDVEDSYHFARFIRASAALCRRNYWRRAWIVLEILLARSLQIYCGDKTLAFTEFLSFCLYNWYTFPLSKEDAVSTSQDQSAIRTSEFARLGRQRDVRGKQSLRDLILAHGSAECFRSKRQSVCIDRLSGGWP